MVHWRPACFILLPVILAILNPKGRVFNFFNSGLKAVKMQGFCQEFLQNLAL